NNGTLSLDPAYGEAASLATVNSFGSGFTADATTGNIAIGQNSAFGYGVSSAAQLTSALADAGISGFSKNGIANAIYLARGIAVSNGHGIAMTNDGIAAPVANTVDLGSNSAVVVAENLVKNKTAAITLANGGAGSVKAQGSNKVILGAGNLTKKDAKGYQVFANTAGSSDLVAGAENVTVSLNSGFYNDTTLNADGTIGEITVDRVGLNYKLARASAPIKQLIGDVADVCGRGEGLGSDFIYQQALISAGADVEAAARLATYGGAYQAAQSVQDAGSNAALARLGLGADNSSTVKGDNVSLWTSLTYKTKDSDSFEAEGVDYGADVDLAGIVVGADFTTDKGARLGAFFNLGSGSADGKGVGSSIDNDFDYYGLGFYAGTKLVDNFELLGDFSFSQISNELKQNVATYGALEGDADMTAISAGILAKYTFNAKVLDVSPYIGVRYSRYDLDSYNVKSYLGTIATTDSKVQNVLSIPVGVGISKTFSNGDWTIKPAADVKLTFNSGDKDVDSVTYFTGAPHGSNLSTEVLDDITYGVSAKVDAQYGATTLGIGINYVGSDNTSEFGLGANARYTF
ncbi:MAG: autotransporter outer membrane beta-barrel domain-containing protein, partial [Succinivibrio sp.]